MPSDSPAVEKLPDLDSLRHLLVDCAGQELLTRIDHAKVQRKRDGSLVTDADLAIQQYLEQRLAQRWPDIPLMGEEMSPRRRRQVVEQGSYWCVDPLDGTSNFTIGLPYFALSLALVQRHRVVLGLVYDPMRDELFSAQAGGGVWLNDQPLAIRKAPARLSEATAMVDFKRLDGGLRQALAVDPPYRSQRCFGAIALEWCWLAAGRCHLYLHGKQNLWDYAAGRLIFAESGGCFLDSDGEVGQGVGLAPVPALAAVSQPLYQQWLGWLQRAGYGAG